MENDIYAPKQIPHIEDITQNINMRTYTNIVDRLMLIATSIFTWEGLDEIARNTVLVDF